MRTRLLAVASAIAASVGVLALSAVGTAGASPTTQHHITIHAQPNPDVVGDPVVIFGRLTGPQSGDQRVTLWHRLPGQPGFTRVGSVHTDANGFYDIPRAEGVVTTNRDWFVRSDGAQSLTVHEVVYAELSINAPATGLTNHPVVISGHVTPNHRGERVVLQEQVGQASDDWHTISSGRIGPGSNYAISYEFKVAGTHTVRTVFRGDRRNIRAASSSLDIVVQQAQNPQLTFSSGSDPINVGQSTTLSGKVTGASAGQVVTLLARQANQSSFVPVMTTLTASDGSFSFVQAPAHNTVYKAQALGRTSAAVFEAVRELVTINASPNSVTVGQTVTFSGTVTPDKTGHTIELQLRGSDGDFHTIQYGVVGAGSVYQLNHVVQSPGQKTYRVRINGGPVNAGGTSPTVTVNVTPGAPTA